MRRRIKRRMWRSLWLATLAAPTFAASAQAHVGKFAPPTHEKYLPSSVHLVRDVHVQGAGSLLILVVATVTAVLLCGWLWQTVRSSFVALRARRAANALS
jgi:hypothetical protein